MDQRGLELKTRVARRFLTRALPYCAITLSTLSLQIQIKLNCILQRTSHGTYRKSTED
jgi:hypothetical protein